MTPRIRPRFVLFLVISGFFMPLFAETGYYIEKTLFLPPEFFIGDHVEMRLRVVPDNNDVNITVPRELPESSWITIESVEAVKGDDGFEVRIRFISFSPGTRTLPAIDLGGIVLDNLKIHTDSIIRENQADFQKLRGQVLLPGTTLFISLFIGILLIVPIPLFFLTRRIWRGFSRITGSRKRKKSCKRISGIIKSLRTGTGRFSNKRFYIIIIDALRTYLSDRTDMDFMTPVTNELPEALGAVTADEAVIADIEELVRFGDYVKFGGMEASVEKKNRDLELVEGIVTHIEMRFSTAEKDAGTEKGVSVESADI